MLMDQLIDLKITNTLKNLQKNQMEAYLVQNREEIYTLLEQLIPEGSTVGFGGSMTLSQLGVIESLRNRPIKLLDRDDKSLTAQQRNEILHACFTADYFLTSSNAITEQGELYNIDGNGNRVAAMIYGPKNVIVIAGINKIVPTLEDAHKRLREIAAPANTIRLNKDTPCSKIGHCMDCRSPQRICSSYVTLGWQQNKGRIKVILVNDCYGF